MTDYPLISNPDRFVWDFWYWFDAKSGLFHLFYLNADYELVPGNRHHFSARVGYGTTRDFTAIKWIDNDLFCADKGRWDNTAIWSGDVVSHGDEFLLFYTSRDRRVDDGLTQYVGVARSPDLRNWERVDDLVLKADERWYETRSLEGDTSIHAWRDPFIFRDERATWMLLSAKEAAAPPGRKGAVALLRAENDNLTTWSAQPPLYAPRFYSECEVPQIYHNDEGNRVLVYSSWAKFDHAPGTEGRGGLHAVVPGQDKPWVLVPESAGLYACRLIPELGGDVVGFDIKRGGLRRLAIATGLKSTKTGL
jgi:beta-fructofuranosidase